LTLGREHFITFSLLAVIRKEAWPTMHKGTATVNILDTNSLLVQGQAMAYIKHGNI